MANETTTRLDMDISGLKKSIQEANRLIRVANSEFKATSSSMDDWGKSADGIQAKLTQLDKVLGGQKTVLSSLERQYALVAAEQGENSKGAQELLIKINNQRAAIASTEGQIKKWKGALNDLNSASDQTENALDRLSSTISSQESELAALKRAYANAVLEFGEGSTEANSLASQISNLSSDLAANKRQMDDASSAADDLDNSMDNLDTSAEDASDGFTVLKGAVATFAGNMATQFVGAVKNGISSLVGLADETKEFRQDMATLNTAFTEVGFSADQATGVWKNLYAVFGEDDRAVEAANNISRMATTQEELNDWVDITTGLWGTYQDALPVESLAEAAGETAKTGTVTGTLADALNWSSEAASMFAGYMGEDVVTAEDAFNVALSECTNEQERQALITSTLTSLYGDAATKYEETAGSVMDANKATADLTLAQAEMGEKIEPVVTTVKQGFADLLTQLIATADGLDMTAVTDAISDAFNYLSKTVLPAVIDGLGWIKDNSDYIIAGIAGIAAAFVAWNITTTIQGVVTAVKAFKLANEGATVAQLLLNAAMKANVIGIVVTAIAALVAAFVVLWNKSEGFRKFWINLWEKIKKITSTVVTAIANFFTGLWDGIKKTWSGVTSWFSNLFSNVYSAIMNVIRPIIDFFVGIWSGIVAIFTPAIEWFSALFTSIWQTLESIVNVIVGLLKGCWTIITTVFGVAAKWFNGKVIQPIAKFFTNLWNGIKTAAQDAWNFIKGIFSGVANWFNNTLVKPVANFFSGMWSNMKKGASDAWAGIKNTFSSVATFFGNIFSTAWNKVKDIFSTGGKIFDGIKEGISTAFKNIVNGLIGGINKVVSVPFNAINGMLNKIRTVSIMGLKPFQGFWKQNPVSIPQIPKLYQGGVLEKGQMGFLEGNGAEAVVPLENNKKWIRKTANDMSAALKGEGVFNTSNQSVVNNYNFNQTNTSPKALSRLEIYRQTKNQLAFVRGV